MQPQFSLGQSVKAISFTNCFGKHVPEVLNLRVAAIRAIDGSAAFGIEPYYRITAESTETYPQVRSVEGAERFFEAVQS